MSASGRQLLAIAVTSVVVAGAVVTSTLALTVGPTPTSASRRAADRDCAPREADRPRRVPGTRLTSRTIATLDAPVAAAFHPSRRGEGVIGEREGRVRRVAGGAVTEELVIDLSDDTLPRGDAGLVALAYDPAAPWLYVYRTDRDWDDEITAHRLDDRGVPVDAEPVVILRVRRPRNLQHHGGGMAFGVDGSLYLGIGDGGGIGDPREQAQDPRTRLGKILRIDPTPWADEPYTVRADNPFVGRPGWSPEIWALGVRNPFRMIVDRATGDLWVGDVGQSCWEELTRLTSADAGANLGWDRFEGHEPYEPGEVPGGHHGPEHVYPHVGGRCAVVAGPVLRGPALPELDGWLLFADFCDGRVLALHTASAGDAATVIDVGLHLEAPAMLVDGPNGVPWALSLEGAIYEIGSR